SWACAAPAEAKVFAATQASKIFPIIYALLRKKATVGISKGLSAVVVIQSVGQKPDDVLRGARLVPVFRRFLAYRVTRDKFVHFRSALEQARRQPGFLEGLGDLQHFRRPAIGARWHEGQPFLHVAV